MEELNLAKVNNLIKREKRILLLLIICIVILFLSSSYALLTNFDKTDNIVNFKTGNLNMTINNVLINLDGKLPENDETGLKNTEPIIITLTNTGTMEIEGYDVKLVSDPNQVSTLEEIYIKYAISLDNGITYLTPDILTNDNNVIYTGYNLKVNESKTIYLKVWLDESSGNNALNKEYYGSIKVDLYQKKDMPDSQEGVYITEVSYKSNTNANLNESKILSTYQTKLDSIISLSKTDSNSSITYEIGVYNSTDYDYYFDSVEYLIDNDNYSNEDITFNVSINEDEVLLSGEYLFFTITFNYRNNELSSNNQLKSFLNFKFRANKRVHVDFDGNGGSVDMTSKEVLFNEPYGELPIPIREGYTFSGWAIEKFGKEIITENNIVNVDSDHTLYAQWNAKSYTIRFNANGGLGTMIDQTIKYDAIVPLSKNTFIKSGYRFFGWATSENGDKEYNDMDNVVNLKLEGILDLYAIWVEESYTVTFDYNGGVGSVESMQVVYNKSYGVLPEYPYNDGKMFVGWYTEKESGTQIFSTSIVNVKENHTLYAHWESVPYNDAIQNLVIKNVPDQNKDGVLDAVYLSFTCSSSFEKYNIPLNNLIVGQKYKLTYTASNNASFGEIESGYKGSMYGSIITKEAELKAGSIKEEAIQAGGLIAQWDDRTKGNQWLNGPFDKEMVFTAEASTMYWTWDFGLMKDGIQYDFNITNIILEPIVPKINFSDKKLIVYSSSTAKVLNDVSNEYESNFIFYGASYAETLYYPITDLIPGSTYTITFEHLYNGKLIDDSASTTNLRYEYGAGIMNSAPTAYGSFMTNIGTWASNTFVMKSVTGNKEIVTLTFTASSDKAYWVWNMANCSDNMNNQISIKVTNFSATHSGGGKINYYNSSS